MYFSGTKIQYAWRTHSRLDKIFSHSFITYMAIDSFTQLGFIENMHGVRCRHWYCWCKEWQKMLLSRSSELTRNAVVDILLYHKVKCEKYFLCFYISKRKLMYRGSCAEESMLTLELFKHKFKTWLWHLTDWLSLEMSVIFLSHNFYRLKNPIG